MGQQQILLIVLSVILVGIAVAIGIKMFKDNARSQTEQAIAQRLQSLGGEAIKLFKTPTSQLGKGGSYTGTVITDLMETPAEDNAVYSITSATDSVLVIKATPTDLPSYYDITITGSTLGDVTKH
jgi:hypothetical protein